MQFHSPLIKGQFLKRYKRFFADIKLDDGQVVVAHVPNTGSMKGLKEANSPCFLSPAQNPERKLKYTLEMIKTPTSWVGVNTSLPNRLVYELWENNKPSHWKNFDRAQLEVKINPRSRLDLVMWELKNHPEIKKLSHKTLNSPMHFTEIKNVTLGEDGVAYFPDAVTERGQKHLEEMMALMKLGFSCEMIYVVQREDCKIFAPADDIDPAYGKLLRKAVKQGLKISAFPAKLTKKDIVLDNKSLKIEL